MYETLEFYDSNGFDLKEVLKSCIYKYYIANKNLDIIANKNLDIIANKNLDISSKKVFKTDKKNSIIKSTNEVKVLSSERS